MTHAVANTLDWLRAGHGDVAVVHGNGYFLTKQAVGVYSRRPPTTAPAPPDGLQERVDARATAVPVETSFTGPGTILAYTVPYDRDGQPGPGIVLVDVGDPASGPRHTVARTDATTSGVLVSTDAVGTAVTLSSIGRGKRGPSGLRKGPTAPLSPRGQGLLGAVLHPGPGVVLPAGRDLVHQQDAVAVVVGVEQVGGEHVAAPVTLAAVGVEPDAHGRTARQEAA